MPLFAKRNRLGVRSFILKLVNNNNAEISALYEGPRQESRTRLTVVAMVVPLVRNRPVVERAFAAVTKEFSTTGVSLVVNGSRAVDELVLAFRGEGEMTYIRGKAKYLAPIGAGFHQLGVELLDIAHLHDYAELAGISF